MGYFQWHHLPQMAGVTNHDSHKATEMSVLNVQITLISSWFSLLVAASMVTGETQSGLVQLNYGQ